LLAYLLTFIKHHDYITRGFAAGVFMGHMPFLSSNHQCQCTKGLNYSVIQIISNIGTQNTRWDGVQNEVVRNKLLQNEMVIICSDVVASVMLWVHYCGLSISQPLRILV